MASFQFIHKFLFTINFACLVGFKFTEVKADSSGTPRPTGRGFGDEIKWFNLDDGLEVSNNSNKPLMLLIHKTWCGACKALKPEFAGSREIKELSKYFIMVNIQDDEEPKDKKFTPDGGYIPRILFLAPGGDVQTDFYNEGGNPSYKYFYSDADSIVVVMKKVADKYKVVGKADDEL